MNKGLFKKILPHLIAVIIFLVVALIYCKPALEGKVVSQHDITHWKGAIHQSEVYAEKHDGEYPLWTNALFSGMPTFQIGYPGNNFIPGIVHKILTLGLPKPIQFFFLASICFYFLCVVLRINPYIGIMGALGFAYATYNAVIISVGHDTKMWSIAYMPALLASVILIYEKKYWLGAALAALFTCVIIAMNHLQITYYIFLVIAIMTIFYIVGWIKNKEWPHLIKAGGLALAAFIIGIMTNAVSLFSTYEYQKKTIRGGGSELVDSTNLAARAQTGLDKDYALSYSMKVTEPLVMMVPRMFGGSSDKAEVKQENSKAIEEYPVLQQKAFQFFSQQLPQEQAQRTTQQFLQMIPFSYYWGGMTKQGEVGTSGPPYVGAIICFLAILSVFVIEKKYKWWALTAIGLTIVMSWGHYFETFNSLLYEYLPFYNKFRAPSMILVVPQLLLSMLAVLGVNEYIKTTDKKTLLPAFKKGLITTGSLFVVLFLLYFSFDFMSGNDNEFVKGLADQPQLYDGTKSFYNGLKADRKALMIGDIFRSLGFIAAVALLVFLFIKNKIKSVGLTISLAALIFIDLITIDSIYLNKENYQESIENESVFQKTKQDEEILADTSYYRVFNFAGNRFQENITSYHYNAVGGYHAAKVLVYQDLIEHQLSQQPNMEVLNMLNTKYFIQKDPATGLTQAYQKNEDALGPAWLVKGIRFVENANEEMDALNNFNPEDTAIVQKSFRSSIPFVPQHDSTATIELIKNDNDIINYSFNSNNNEFAVFSEVYYDAGWKALIDGKEAPIVKVNYVLRGLSVPAGKHEIAFRFEPQGFIKGRKITSVFSYVLLALLAFGIFMEWYKRSERNPSERKNKKKPNAV